MSIIQNLTPVEALYLLDYAGIETMTAENSLAANLGYLANNGFIEAHDNFRSSTHLILSNHGKKILDGTADRNIMNAIRQYELDSLKAITEDNEYDLSHAVTNFNFKKHLTNEGFFQTKNKPLIPKVSLLDFITIKENVPTEKYRIAIAALKSLRLGLTDNLSHNNSRYISPLIYAFPSSDLKDVYSKLAKTIIHDGSFGFLENMLPPINYF